ncbi:MAG: hypothetical protein HRT88_02205 [Lentisphaeraceae bacterium]|nr:hypothetical protein [Lentisphaeraceae bacterium]
MSKVNVIPLERRSRSFRFLTGPLRFIKLIVTILATAVFSCSIALLLIKPWFAEYPKIVVVGGYIFVPIWGLTLCLCAWTKVPWRLAIIFLAIGAALLGINYAWVNL